MALGAEEAFGCPPSWILSFPGLCKHQENEDGSVKSASNEYHYLTYMKKHNKLPPYMAINRGIFDDIVDEEKDFNPEFIKTDFSTTDTIDISNTDIVCALPVCSGLSLATRSATDETIDSRNNNMKWVTKYVLKMIKPKAYIFENAPALYSSDRAKEIREFIEKEAFDAGYSVTYFKTDTYKHNNAQSRPRTFCICWKWQNGTVQAPPVINYENAEISVEEFFKQMPKYINSKPSEMYYINQMLFDFIRMKYPDSWREKMNKKTIAMTIITENLDNEYIDFIMNSSNVSEKQKETLVHMIKHAREKYDAGSWIYDSTLKLISTDKKISAIMHKNSRSLIHPFEDRLLTTGELAYCMGLPTDWQMYGGDIENYQQIGQNVPVKTARFICSEIMRIVSDWDNLRGVTHANSFFGDPDNVEHVDNMTQQYSI